VRSSQLIALLLILSPITAFAEVGDVHTINVDIAVVYEGPDKSSAEAGKLPKGTEVMEMDTQGEWFEIYDADSDVGGWMPKSNMEILGGGDAGSVASEAAAVAEPDKPVASAKPVGADTTSAEISLKSSGAKSPGLQKFEQYLQKYNIRTKEVKGYVPFTSAEDAGNGELKLTVTNRWLDNPRARRTTSLITIYSKWKRANNSPNVRVLAVDPSGNPIANYPRSR